MVPLLKLPAAPFELTQASQGSSGGGGGARSAACPQPSALARIAQPPASEPPLANARAGAAARKRLSSLACTHAKKGQAVHSGEAGWAGLL
jgi:hypothetical protein